MIKKSWKNVDHTIPKGCIQHFLNVFLADVFAFAYVAHFVFMRDVWIRTQNAAVASRRAYNLATHLLISHPSP
jgi:hypothetical protein